MLTLLAKRIWRRIRANRCSPLAVERAHTNAQTDGRTDRRTQACWGCAQSGAADDDSTSMAAWLTPRRKRLHVSSCHNTRSYCTRRRMHWMHYTGVASSQSVHSDSPYKMFALFFFFFFCL